MTSRPLFMSVDESTVILGPIDQVGWARASATVTSARSSRLRPRKGAPLAVGQVRRPWARERAPPGREDDPGHSIGVAADVRRQALMDGAVLGVDGHD